MGKRRKKARNTRVQKPVQKIASKSRWIPLLLGSALFTALFTAGLEYFFLAPTRDKMEFSRSLRLQTAPQLRALYNFATVGKYMQRRTWILLPPPRDVLEKVERDTQWVLVPRLGFNEVSVKPDTLTLTFPALVSDLRIRNQWDSLQIEVASQLGSLDTGAFREYQDLRLFLLRYPLPASDTLEASMMPWSEINVQDEWHQINNRICCMVERRLQLAQMAEDQSIWGVMKFAIADHRIQNNRLCESLPSDKLLVLGRMWGEMLA